MKKDVFVNLITGVALLGVVVFIYIQTSGLSAGSATFPRLLSVVLACLTLGLIGQSVWSHYRNKKITPDRLKQKRSGATPNIRQQLYPFIIIIFCVLFILAFDRIGFEISAFILMFGTMLLIDRKEGVHKFYFAVAVPAVLILIFKIGIKLRIPLLIERFFR